MSRRIPWLVVTLVAIGAALTPWLLQVNRVYVRHFENVLGTSMDLKVLAGSADAAAEATRVVVAEIDRESSILSSYDPSSEFSRWFQTRDVPVNVSPELFDVLSRFDTWRDRTHGALDPAAETISRVWASAARVDRVPTDAELADAVGVARQAHWRLDVDAAGHTATHLDRAPLVLNSFVKSYIVSRAADRGARTRGVSAIVVNVGGDLVSRGPWTETVSVTDPRASADNAPPMARIRVRDRAVATSGGYRRGFDIAGVHYSHIVDPRTGHPTGHVISATVVARDAADAGALATSFCVLGIDESRRLAALVPGAEFLLVLADGREVSSAGWRTMAIAPVRPVALPSGVATLHAAEQGLWRPDFELTIAFEIALQPMRANRPYVAVWIDDKDRFPVRTLAVWYRASEPRYLGDLRSWYRGDRLRNLAEGTDVLDSISSATRAPGKYLLVWDGKDNGGKPVKAGTYAVNIEAAREHGTYQIIRQDLDFSGVPKKVTLPGNVEIASASLDYHRVSGR